MSDRLEIFCLHLGELEPGKVSLRAPTAKGAVQIEWYGEKEDFCELDVDVETDSVSVKRKDKKGLQLNLYGEGAKDKDDHLTCLGEPVDEIIFQRLEGDIWAIEPEDIDIIYISGLQIFASILGQFAREKQQSN